MIFLVFAFIILIGLFVVWEVFEGFGRKETHQHSPERSVEIDPGNIRLWFRTWKNSHWALPTSLFGFFFLLSLVDYTREIHFWFHIPNRPLLFASIGPGHFRIGKGAKSQMWRFEHFTMLTETGKRMAPKETSAASGVIKYDINAVPNRFMLSPRGLFSLPSIGKATTQIILPFWFIGIVAAGIGAAFDKRFRSRSKPDH